ncbi:AraC family transcriptional regulator [Alisedimentitalea sp. MJ-SS2]|uniref:helix-turn-helix transcriptional regulator n=1 Tax=Aliisedimentitalea sp. MJ-SS2 TaxID=3049795 RepID=UPI00291532FF|nr:AraC family transcriptional regulator [Alisedimentitalea sp. MJ-SS2]MDU8929779.1 AraC family transcriptional regulator [Alisedimentitalea sp. MJ-SS2]
MNDDIPRTHPLARISGGESWRMSLPHSTDYARLIWLARGHGQMMMDGIQLAASPNMAIFVPAETLFSMSVTGPLFGTMLSIPVGADIPLPQHAHGIRVPSAQTQSELTTLLDDMMREQQRGLDFHAQAARAYAILISVWLRRTSLVAPPLPDLRADQRLSQRFARLIVREFRNGKPMSWFAEQLDVTPGHLSRACKHASGQSASNLLTGRVLHETRRLLADSSYKIGRIAAYLGFRSASHFTRFVQNQTAASPTRLRIDAPRRRDSSA